MFGNKKFKQIKTEKFANDKERKRFFAIQSYYSKDPSFKKMTTSEMPRNKRSDKK